MEEEEKERERGARNNEVEEEGETLNVISQVSLFFLLLPLVR